MGLRAVSPLQTIVSTQAQPHFFTIDAVVTEEAMPLRNRLRLRRNRPSRMISDRRTGLNTLAQLLPRAAILPILLFAGGTAMATAYWTYDIHVEQAYGEVEEQDAMQSMDSAN